MCKHLLALSVLAAITLITPAQAEEAASMPAMTDEAMITSAMAAAPVKVGAGATIVAMGADGKMRTLREGSNGFTCMPDNPATPGPDPMCMDAAAMAIGYYDATNADLKFATFNGSTWTLSTVDSTGDVGQNASLAFSPAGQPATVAGTTDGCGHSASVDRADADPTLAQVRTELRHQSADGAARLPQWCAARASRRGSATVR